MLNSIYYQYIVYTNTMETKTTYLSSYTGKSVKLTEHEKKGLKKGHKICLMCRQQKPTDEFYPIGPRCRTSYCRICCKSKSSIDRMIKLQDVKVRNSSLQKLPNIVQHSIMDDIALGKSMADISRRYKIPYQNLMMWKRKGKLVRPKDYEDEHGNKIYDYYEEDSEVSDIPELSDVQEESDSDKSDDYYDDDMC